MRMIEVAGATHVFTKPKDWDEGRFGPCHDAPARMDRVGEPDEEGHQMVTLTVAYVATPAEARQIAAGALLELTFCSNVLPAHAVRVVSVLPTAEVPHGAPALSINEDAHGMGHDDFGPATP